MPESNAEGRQASGLNPQALRLADMARILTASGPRPVTEEMLQADIDDGAPVNADGTMHLVQYVVWLVKGEVYSMGYMKSLSTARTSSGGLRFNSRMGAGDSLPVSDTSVVVVKRQVVNAAFDPDDMAVLLVTTTKRVSIEFVDAGGAVLLALDLAAGECCLWWLNSGIARPMTGNAVAAIHVGNGDSVTSCDVTISVLYDSTP